MGYSKALTVVLPSIYGHVCKLCGNLCRASHLSDKLEDMARLEAQLNAALRSRIPPKIAKKRHRMAMDLHLIPYYGVPTDVEAPYVYRSQGKSGTTRFFAYATVYVICRNKRVTSCSLDPRLFRKSRGSSHGDRQPVGKHLEKFHGKVKMESFRVSVLKMAIAAA